MYQGDADEAVVVVKPSAEDGMVTYLRRKLAERDKEVKGEGRNKKSGHIDHYYLLIRRVRRKPPSTEQDNVKEPESRGSVPRQQFLPANLQTCR